MLYKELKYHTVTVYDLFFTMKFHEVIFLLFSLNALFDRSLILKTSEQSRSFALFVLQYKSRGRMFRVHSQFFSVTHHLYLIFWVLSNPGLSFFLYFYLLFFVLLSYSSNARKSTLQFNFG